MIDKLILWRSLILYTSYLLLAAAPVAAQSAPQPLIKIYTNLFVCVAVPLTAKVLACGL